MKHLPFTLLLGSIFICLGVRDVAGAIYFLLLALYCKLPSEVDTFRLEETLTHIEDMMVKDREEMDDRLYDSGYDDGSDSSIFDSDSSEVDEYPEQLSEEEEYQ